ncbi:MAG TPA: hypothetical protein VNS61_09515 [Caldimonas sp.]|nr:hypothetical protein [Caldimonas sp.]
MKHLALSVLPLLALVGCGSLPPAIDKTDSARIAAVDRAALRSGVQVVWINLPHKKTPADGGS